MLNDYNRRNHTNKNVFKVQRHNTRVFEKLHKEPEVFITNHMGEWEFVFKAINLGFQNLREKTVVSINYINTCVFIFLLYV